MNERKRKRDNLDSFPTPTERCTRALCPSCRAVKCGFAIFRWRSSSVGGGGVQKHPADSSTSSSTFCLVAGLLEETNPQPLLDGS